MDAGFAKRFPELRPAESSIPMSTARLVPLQLPGKAKDEPKIPPAHFWCACKPSHFRYWPQCFVKGWKFRIKDKQQHDMPFQGMVRETRFPDGKGGYVQCPACEGPHPKAICEFKHLVLDILVPRCDPASAHPKCSICKVKGIPSPHTHMTIHHNKSQWLTLEECVCLVPDRYKKFLLLDGWAATRDYWVALPIRLYRPDFPVEKLETPGQSQQHWYTGWDDACLDTNWAGFEGGLVKVTRGTVMRPESMEIEAHNFAAMTACIRERKAGGDLLDPYLTLKAKAGPAKGKPQINDGFMGVAHVAGLPNPGHVPSKIGSHWFDPSFGKLMDGKLIDHDLAIVKSLRADFTKSDRSIGTEEKLQERIALKAKAWAIYSIYIPQMYLESGTYKVQPAFLLARRQILHVAASVPTKQNSQQPLAGRAQPTVPKPVKSKPQGPTKEQRRQERG